MDRGSGRELAHRAAPADADRALAQVAVGQAAAAPANVDREPDWVAQGTGAAAREAVGLARALVPAAARQTTRRFAVHKVVRAINPKVMDNS